MNAFYNASGNPATGSEGLSAIVRAEFAAISVAFDNMPSLRTTGVATTTFAQLGSFTFTLPATSGTLALNGDLTTEVTRALAAEAALTSAGGTYAASIAAEAVARASALAVETARAKAAELVLTASVGSGGTTSGTAIAAEITRATAAELGLSQQVANEVAARAAAITAETNARAAAVSAENVARTAADVVLSTALGTKQNTIGFTPVQQGTGAGQLGNTIKIGWSLGGLKAQVDGIDLGAVPTTTNGQGFATTAAVAAAYQPRSDANPYVTNVWGGNNTYLGYNGGQLVAQIDSTYFGQVPTSNFPGNFIQNGTIANLASLNISSTMFVSGSTAAAGTGPYMTPTGIQTTPAAWNWQVSVGANGGFSGSGFMTFSDRRAKADIEDVSAADAIGWVMRARPRTYLMNGVPSAGFVAQEDIANGRGAAVIALTTTDERYAVSDGVVPAGQRLSRNYLHDVAYLTAALQVALRRITALEARMPA